jgi:hypothetical protein
MAAVNALVDAGLAERYSADVSWSRNRDAKIDAVVLSVDGAAHLGVILHDDPKFRGPRPPDHRAPSYSEDSLPGVRYRLSHLSDKRLERMRWVDAKHEPTIKSKSVPQFASRRASLIAERLGGRADDDSAKFDAARRQRAGGQLRSLHAPISVLELIVRFRDDLERYPSQKRLRSGTWTVGYPADPAPRVYRILGSSVPPPTWRNSIEDKPDGCRICGGRPLEPCEACLGCRRTGIDHLLDEVPKRDTPKTSKGRRGSTMKHFARA